MSSNGACLPVLEPLVSDKYIVCEKLGRGCFANVYRVISRSDGTQFAMKIVDKRQLDSETTALLENEHDVLQTVSEHPGVVTLHESITTQTHVYFVLDYVKGGPLLDKVVSHGAFSENDARLVLKTILRTLSFMSKVGVVHRDIKPENILVDNVDRSWPVKLTDFGMSAKMQKREVLYSVCGTPYFVAPEVLKKEGYDCACDMWSLGVVMYIIICGYPPFFQKDPKDLIKAILCGRFSFPEKEWSCVSEDAKDVLRKMLTVSPAKRIKPAEALRHPWFAAEQSNNVLSNEGLGKFNARRKLRAAMLMVRSTFDFLDLLDEKQSLGNESKKAIQLVHDVEKSRALIRALYENEAKNKDHAATRQNVHAKLKQEDAVPDLKTRPPSNVPHKSSSGTLRRRRSLVLPTISAADSNTVSQKRNGKSSGNLKELMPSSQSSNQCIAAKKATSRAKAMVDDMKHKSHSGGKNVTGSSPFLKTSKGTTRPALNLLNLALIH